MNLNPYVAEKLMKQQQMEMQKAARKAWVNADARKSRNTLFARLMAIGRRIASSKNVTVNDPCCNCC